MGSSTSTTSQQSTTNPWEPAQPALKEILAQIQGGLGNTGLTTNENNALNQMTQNAGSASEFTGQLKGLVDNLMGGGGANAQSGMVNNAYQDLQRRLGGMADGSEIGANSGLKPYLDSIAADTTSQVNGMFAGAGRDFSGMNMQTLARGIMQGQAPVVAAQYNADKANQIGAANTLYGAGMNTAGALSGMTQQGLQNATMGASMAPLVQQSRNAGAQAMLEAEAARRGIPVQNLGMLAQLAIPIAGLGGTTNSTGTTTKTMSPIEMISSLANSLGNLGKGWGAAKSGGWGWGG